MSGRPGTNWNGHLPSNKMEMEILNAIDAIEDEDGQVSQFMNPGDEPLDIHVKQSQAAAGAKAVLADHSAHTQLAALQRQAMQVRMQEQLAGMQVGVKNPTAAPVEEDEEDEEDEAFAAYRMQRLQQLKDQAAATANLPTFGELQMCDIDNFIERVEPAPVGGSPLTFVVVHLFEEYQPLCVRLNFRLQVLAKKYDQVRFLAIPQSEARPHGDPTELPTLAIYQNGDYRTCQKRCQVRRATHAHHAYRTLRPAAYVSAPASGRARRRPPSRCPRGSAPGARRQALGLIGSERSRRGGAAALS